MTKFTYISATSIGALAERLNEIKASRYKILNTRMSGSTFSFIEVIAESEA